VTVINAGHLPPLWRRGPRAVEPVGESEANLPLGVDRDVEYAQHTLPLAPGDSLVLYTDGITEAMNAKDELYGLPRLLSVLDGEIERPATAVAGVATVNLLGRRILDDVKRFVGARPQSDDMCLTCFVWARCLSAHSVGAHAGLQCVPATGRERACRPPSAAVAWR
jgi:serine phosphatase RsbU (regulator of sigma subunit)